MIRGSYNTINQVKYKYRREKTKEKNKRKKRMIGMEQVCRQEVLHECQKTIIK
jgi:hypothetical protein